MTLLDLKSSGLDLGGSCNGDGDGEGVGRTGSVSSLWRESVIAQTTGERGHCRILNGRGRMGK